MTACCDRRGTTYLFLTFIRVQLLYNVGLVRLLYSKVNQLYVYIYPLFKRYILNSLFNYLQYVEIELTL